MIRSPIRVALLLGASLALLAACAPREERAAGHRERAAAYLVEGKRDEALIELQKALQLDPDDAETHYQLGRLTQMRGRPDEALFFYREAWRLDPERSHAALAAAALLIRERPEQARELVEAVLERDPSQWLAYVRRSEIALLEDDTQRALADALKAVELAPEEGDPYLNLAFVHQARIREQQLEERQVDDTLFEAALEALDRSRSTRTEAWTWRERMNRAQLLAAWPGHSDEASQGVREAVEDALGHAGPGVQHTALNQAFQFARRSEDRELERWVLERFVEVEGAPISAWRQLARLREQGEAGSGEQVLRRLVEERPRSVEAHVTLARFLASHERKQDALDHLRETAEAGVEPPLALAALLNLALELGERNAALDAVERLERDYPDDPLTEQARAQRDLTTGRPEQAAERLRKLVVRRGTPDVYRLLAGVELRLGQVEAAREAVERAAELEGTPSLRSLRLRLRIDQAARNWPGVVQTGRVLLQRARVLSPWETVIFARGLWRTGNQPLARNLLRGLVESDYSVTEAVLELAQLEGARDPQAARRVLERGVERQPGSLALLQALVALDLQQQRPEDALARIDSVAAKQPLNAPLLFARSRALAATGRIEDAQRDALRVLQAAPNQPGIVGWLVGLYRQGEGLESLIASFEEAERVGALNAPSRVLLARLHLEQGQGDRAIALLEAALAERDDLPGAKNDLAYQLAQQDRDLDRALELAREARAALDDNHAAADTLAYVYLKKQMPDAALEPLRRAIALAEEQGAVPSTYLYHLGLALRALGRNEEAVQAFERSLAGGGDFPESGEARRALEAALQGSDPDANPS